MAAAARRGSDYVETVLDEDTFDYRIPAVCAEILGCPTTMREDDEVEEVLQGWAQAGYLFG